jgi:hypothetical protein
LGKLSLSVRRRHLRPRHLCPRRDDRAVKLRKGPTLGELHVRLDVLLDVDTGASDELPLAIRQSFKDCCYSPTTGMEEREWQIMCSL